MIYYFKDDETERVVLEDGTNAIIREPSLKSALLRAFHLSIELDKDILVCSDRVKEEFVALVTGINRPVWVHGMRIKKDFRKRKPK